MIRAEAIAEFDAGQRRRDAEREALVRQNSENRRRELEARATARTRAGETGLDASHVDRAIAFDASTARTDARRDFQRFSRDIDQNLEDVERGATSQLNAIRPPTPPAPLGFELGELALSAIRRG